MPVFKKPQVWPCCDGMRTALGEKQLARLEIAGGTYVVEYTSPTAKDTIRPRALNFCPWCGAALVWPVPAPRK